MDKMNLDYDAWSGIVSCDVAALSTQSLSQSPRIRHVHTAFVNESSSSISSLAHQSASFMEDGCRDVDSSPMAYSLWQRLPVSQSAQQIEENVEQHPLLRKGLDEGLSSCVSTADAQERLQLLQPNTAPWGVAASFSMRTGGVSAHPFDSLNLSYAVGDDPRCVDENRRRFISATAYACSSSLPHGEPLNPHQVHGIEVEVVTTPAQARAFADASLAGERPKADAVVCTVPGVPVLLTFADCVPLILVCPGGFAVVHSGWRSTLGKISLHAVQALLASCPQACAADVHAWIGPHISEEVYEVSSELITDFVRVFGEDAQASIRHLHLDACVAAALREAGLLDHHIHAAHACTYQHPHLFFTHRLQGPVTGRIGALAWLIETSVNG